MSSQLCMEMIELMEQHAAAMDAARSLDQEFTAYGDKLEQVEEFKYLSLTQLAVVL